VPQCLSIGTNCRGFVRVAGARSHEPSLGGCQPVLGCLVERERGGGSHRSFAERTRSSDRGSGEFLYSHCPRPVTHGVALAVEQRLLSLAHLGVDLEIERWAETPAGLILHDAPALTLALEAFERVLGSLPLLLRSGGTLPVIEALAAREIPTVMTGFDVPEGNVHAPNERLLLSYIPIGIQAACETLVAFGNLAVVSWGYPTITETSDP
jgi:hypothetical protein